MSIGEDLAQARHQAGLTVAEVSRSTRIREKLIRDIEHDDYSACGGDFYARGHIRAIAHVVGADAERLIWEYDDDAARTRDEIATADTGPLAGLSGTAAMPERPSAGGRVPPASTGGWPGPLGTARLPGTARPPEGGAGGTPGSFIPGGLGGHGRLPGTGRRRPMNWAVVLGVAVLAALGVVAYQFISSSASAPGKSRAAGTGSGTHRQGGHTGQHPAPDARRSASLHARRGHTAPPRAGGTGSHPTTRPTAAAQPLTPVSVTAFGPGGPGQGDNPQFAPQAIDARQSTAWQSDWYSTPRFGGLQKGTGLLLDMGRPVTVTSAQITLGGTPGAIVQVRAGGTAAMPGLRPVARAGNAGGAVQLQVTRPAQGRYVLIWFTRLPPDASGTFQVKVYDIRLMGS